jgi:MoxR-like ATPase
MATNSSDSTLTGRVEAVAAWGQQVAAQVGEVIVGQDPLIERLLVALVSRGHVLLEGVPGLGKSLAVATFARVLGLDQRRIQFTPDLLPADLIGTQVLEPGTGQFRLQKGPLATHIVLADEINRAPPKVQSALLEAMQERQLTIGERTDPLPDPFLVLATQNPIEQEGTYPLPEAELDRFLLKVVLDYPDPASEVEILKRHGRVARAVEKDLPAQAAELSEASAVVDAVFVDDKILDYIVRITTATRDAGLIGLTDRKQQIRYGASPRGSLSLLLAAKAHAVLKGREYVSPRDVKTLAPDVLRHRLLLSFEAQAQDITAAAVLDDLLDHIEVP